MGLVTDTFRGAGNAIFALGEPFRQDSRRQLAELEGRAKERMAEAQKAAREAEEWRRKYQLESEDRAYPRAVQAFELEQKKGDADLGRQLVTLGANERAGINLYNTANAGKIAFTEADYKAQGVLTPRRAPTRSPKKGPELKISAGFRVGPSLSCWEGVLAPWMLPTGGTSSARCPWRSGLTPRQGTSKRATSTS